MTQIKKITEEYCLGKVRDFAISEYGDLLDYRRRVDDCLQGQRNIKSKQTYLPPNQWQQEHTTEYEAYLQRALFYSMTTYAMRIYEGLTMSGFPEIILPTDGKMDFLRRWATVHKRDLHTLQANLNREQLSHGLRCMLVESQNNPDRPFFIQEFGANMFLRAYFTASQGSESKAKMILLDESGYSFDVKLKTDVYQPRLLVLGLDRNNEYYQCKIGLSDWGDKFDIDNPPATAVYPSYRGQRIDFIPFTWCGASSLSGSALDLPPLLDMADCEIKLFQLDAQYSQHLFQSSQETVFFTNTDRNFKLEDIRYGCGAHNKLPNNVDVKVIANNGIGFEAQKNYMESIMAQIELRRMSIMSSKSHQSGTAVGIVQNAQTAPLRTIVDTSGDAITEQLRYIATWMGYAIKDISRIAYAPSKDFANADNNLSEFVSLCQSVADGSVPMLEEDLYRKAKENGYVNSKMEWKDFKIKWRLEKLERQESLGFIPQSNGNLFSKNKDNSDNKTDDVPIDDGNK
jgi:hypothetical protein